MMPEESVKLAQSRSLQDRIETSGEHDLLERLCAGVSLLIHDPLDALGGWNI